MSEFVPGVDLVHVAGGVFDDTERTNLMEVVKEMHLTAGKWHTRLERGLEEWFGVAHARLVNSGSSANLLAVAALMSPKLGVRALVTGDEVITVAAGFPTTVAPMIQLGLIPVFVDVSLPGANIDVSQLEGARSIRTRAVMVAHTLGNPFDLQAVMAFCQKHDFWLIEDNCDAAGSTYWDRKTGTFGDLATLSFYPAHHMTTGEGGAVLTSNPKLAKIVTSLRDWGRDCWCMPDCDNTCKKRFAQQHGSLPQSYDHKYTYSHLGYNMKMTDMQAAVGVAQLAKLDSFCATRRSNWSTLRHELSNVSGCWLTFQEPREHCSPSWFGFLVTVDPDAPFTRDDVVRDLEAAKIQTRMLFAGNLVRHPAMYSKNFRVIGDLPRTDYLMERAFWIGVYSGITAPMLDHMITTIRRVCQ